MILHNFYPVWEGREALTIVTKAVEETIHALDFIGVLVECRMCIEATSGSSQRSRKNRAETPRHRLSREKLLDGD